MQATLSAASSSGGGGRSSLVTTVAIMLAFGVWVVGEVSEAKEAATEAKAALDSVKRTSDEMRTEIEGMRRKIDDVADRNDRTVADVRRMNTLLEWMAERMFPDAPLPKANP